MINWDQILKVFEIFEKIYNYLTCPKLKIAPIDPARDLRSWRFYDTGWIRKFANLHVENRKKPIPEPNQAYLPPGEYEVEIIITCENGKGDKRRYKILSPQRWDELNMIEI